MQTRRETERERKERKERKGNKEKKERKSDNREKIKVKGDVSRINFQKTERETAATNSEPSQIKRKKQGRAGCIAPDKDSALLNVITLR